MNKKHNTDGKECVQCLVFKPLSDFHTHFDYADALEKKCKPCKRADMHTNYIKNKKNYIDRNKRVYTTRGKAISAVHLAIKSKNLIKGVCEVCSATKVEFHHTDGYDKENWLIGKWLCKQHHADEHVRIRRKIKGVPRYVKTARQTAR